MVQTPWFLLKIPRSNPWGCRSIPNNDKFEQLLFTSQHDSNSSIFFYVNYRVQGFKPFPGVLLFLVFETFHFVGSIKFDAGPYPFPLVLFGSLAGAAMENIRVFCVLCLSISSRLHMKSPPNHALSLKQWHGKHNNLTFESVADPKLSCLWNQWSMKVNSLLAFTPLDMILLQQQEWSTEKLPETGGKLWATWYKVRNYIVYIPPQG